MTTVSPVREGEILRNYDNYLIDFRGFGVRGALQGTIDAPLSFRGPLLRFKQRLAAGPGVPPESRRAGIRSLL